MSILLNCGHLRPRVYKIFGLLLWCLALAACQVIARAQDTDDEIVRINSTVVSLEVLVTDKHTGERVDGLKAEDFEVTDDGRPRPLAFFSQGQAAKDRLALVLLTDLNLDSLSKVEMLRLRAALRRAMWGSLQFDDQVAVVSLSPDFKIVRALGYDRQGVLRSLTPTAGGRDEQTQAASGGDIAAEVLAAVRHVQDSRKQFRIELVVVTERSYGTLQQAAPGSVEQLLASGAVVNVIRASKRKGDTLDYICEQTGGENIHIRGTDYSDALEGVIENLARRYSLGFVPDVAPRDHGFHSLDVSVRNPNHRALEVRARRGYFAETSAGRAER
jgi:VWFA-related protein